MLRAQASSAASALRVLRSPRKVGLILAGNLGAQLLQAVILGLCLRAFGYQATMAELILVNTIANLFAGFMPVPGGMGVAEAAYTAGLVALPGRPQRDRDVHRDRLPDGHLLPPTGVGLHRHALAATTLVPVVGSQRVLAIGIGRRSVWWPGRVLPVLREGRC